MAKQRGILFNTEMVKAILDLRKKKTRRTDGLEKFSNPDDSGNKDNPSRWLLGGFLDGAQWIDDLDTLEGEWVKCPKGKVGDQLYVRETWRIAAWDFDDCEVLVEYKDGTKLWMPMHDPAEDSMWLQEQIDKLVAKGVLKAERGGVEEDLRYHFTKPAPWKPGIHMPKCFSRIWLQIEDIRVERVQDISEEDAKDEGSPMILSPCNWHHHYDWFKELWQKINGTESWEINPWTWAISFQVLSKEGEPTKDSKQANTSADWSDQTITRNTVPQSTP